MCVLKPYLLYLVTRDEQVMTSYAKQTNEASLYKLATGILVRAIRRCSEVLERFKTRAGARTDQPRVGGDPRSRKEPVKNAGLSRHQSREARRLGRQPEC